MSKNPGYLLHAERLQPYLELMSLEERGKLFTAVNIYALSGEAKPSLLQMGDIAKATFEVIKAEIDENSSAYRTKCEQNRKNATRSGNDG